MNSFSKEDPDLLGSLKKFGINSLNRLEEVLKDNKKVEDIMGKFGIDSLDELENTLDLSEEYESELDSLRKKKQNFYKEIINCWINFLFFFVQQ